MTDPLRATVESDTPLPNGIALYRLRFAAKIMRSLSGGEGAKACLERIAAEINAAIDARVSELLAANNREVERRRQAEAALDRVSRSLRALIADSRDPGAEALAAAFEAGRVLADA